MEEVTLAMLRQILLGRTVSRDTAVLPNNGVAQNLFTITGGRALLTLLVGEFTVAGNAVAATMRWQHTASGGGAVSYLSAASASLSSKAIGTLLGLSGLDTDAMLVSSGESALIGLTRYPILRPGTLAILGGGANSTGSVKYLFGYVPIDDGVEVVAA